jgi:hypothetical protein
VGFSLLFLPSVGYDSDLLGGGIDACQGLVDHDLVADRHMHLGHHTRRVLK